MTKQELYELATAPVSDLEGAAMELREILNDCPLRQRQALGEAIASLELCVEQLMALDS